MKTLSTLAVAAAFGATAVSASAVVIDARFAGTVQSQTGTGFAINAPVSGEFVYDTATSAYLSFTVGGANVASGYGSAAVVTPDQYSALYQAQLSPLQQGGTLNSTFKVDLEGLNKWPSFDAVALLTNGSQLPANLDTASSSFGYYTANADGTNIRQMTASLTTFAAAAVPEPPTLVLLLLGTAVVAVRTTQRKR